MAPLDTWNEYPLNLEGFLNGCHAHAYDLEALKKQLDDESTRLCVNENANISVRIIELGGGVHTFSKNHELDQYMASWSSVTHTRIVIIRQQGSWGPLAISKRGLLQLLTLLDAFPSLIDMLCTFGQQTWETDAPYGGFAFISSNSSSRHEMSYLIKHVEKNNRTHNHEDWSLRKMGVYHQISDSGPETLLLLNPSVPCLKRINKIGTTNPDATAWDVQAAILSSATVQWRVYMRDLESRFWEMNTKAQVTKVHDTRVDTLSSLGDINLSDTQAIQRLQHTCQVLSNVLWLDRSLLRNMVSCAAKIQVDSPHAQCDFVNLVSCLAEDVDTQTSRLTNLLERLRGTIKLIQTILDLNCLANMRNNTRSMKTIAEATKEESANVLELTRKAAHDTEIMKTLAWLGLIYLPVSLAASVAGMHYIIVDNSKSPFAIDFAGGFYVFLVLVALFLTATFIIYRVWIVRVRQTEKGAWLPVTP